MYLTKLLIFLFIFFNIFLEKWQKEIQNFRIQLNHNVLQTPIQLHALGTNSYTATWYFSIMSSGIKGSSVQNGFSILSTSSFHPCWRYCYRDRFWVDNDLYNKKHVSCLKTQTCVHLKYTFRYISKTPKRLNTLNFQFYNYIL